MESAIKGDQNLFSVILTQTWQMEEGVTSKMTHYADHKWNLCDNLKVVAVLLGLELEYTKYMCFLCLWNSHDDASSVQSETVAKVK